MVDEERLASARRARRDALLAIDALLMAIERAGDDEEVLIGLERALSRVHQPARRFVSDAVDPSTESGRLARAGLLAACRAVAALGVVRHADSAGVVTEEIVSLDSPIKMALQVRMQAKIALGHLSLAAKDPKKASHAEYGAIQLRRALVGIHTSFASVTREQIDSVLSVRAIGPTGAAARLIGLATGFPVPRNTEVKTWIDKHIRDLKKTRAR